MRKSLFIAVLSFFIALSFFSCSEKKSSSFAESDKLLAASILSDSTLVKVDRMGHSLLTRGYNAGDGYSEVWIRDFNTFIETSMDAVSPSDVREALTVFFMLQQQNGEVVDGYVLKEDFDWDDSVRYYSEAAPRHVGFKNTVETDQETSLIQAVRKYVERTGDTDFLSLEVAGITVYERMQAAIDYLTREKRDATYHLLTGALTADWGDVENDSVCCVDIGEGSVATIDIYDNAMMVIALRDMQQLSPDDESKAKWGAMEQEYRRNIRKHLWDSRRQRFIPHLYPDGKPKEVYFDESQIYYHGGTAIAIEADLLTADEVRKVNADMLENVRESGMPSIGLTVYPTYPSGFFYGGMSKPFYYQNGGDWTWFGGRMIQGLIRYGLVGEAYQELRPMIDRVIVNGDFYEWYGIGNQPRGSSAFKGSAGVLCKAIAMLRAWAVCVKCGTKKTTKE